jgi:hypothetical protein
VLRGFRKTADALDLLGLSAGTGIGQARPLPDVRRLFRGAHMSKRLVVALLVLAPAMAWLPARAAPAEVIDLTSITPGCELPYTLKADKSACEANPAVFKAIKVQAECEKVAGAKWDAGACTAPTDATLIPKPTCGSRLSDLSYNADKKSCQVIRETPRRSLGDFVGDCFKIHSPPPEGVDDQLKQGMYFIVESQTRTPTEDKELVVSPARPAGLGGMTFWCRTTGARERRINASTLVSAGAHRYGWSYGVLTLPFKYYAHDKSFTPGALNVGPFLGRRWGSAGSAITAAVAATIGSVRGEIKDTQGNITSTPDLTAFSIAIGLMLDVSNNPDLKPFKMGLFYGVETVSGADGVNYKHNRKPWVAFQIGYDFTDTK